MKITLESLTSTEYVNSRKIINGHRPSDSDRIKAIQNLSIDQLSKSYTRVRDAARKTLTRYKNLTGESVKKDRTRNRVVSAFTENPVVKSVSQATKQQIAHSKTVFKWDSKELAKNFGAISSKNAPTMVELKALKKAFKNEGISESQQKEILVQHIVRMLGLNKEYSVGSPSQQKAEKEIIDAYNKMTLKKQIIGHSSNPVEEHYNVNTVFNQLHELEELENLKYHKEGDEVTWETENEKTILQALMDKYGMKQSEAQRQIDDYKRLKELAIKYWKKY